MKRLLSAICALVMCFSLCFAANAADTPPATAKSIFTISSASCKPGDTVELTISIASSEEVNTIALSNFTFNQSALEFVAFSLFDSQWDAKKQFGEPDSANQAITLGLKTAEKAVGTICIATFRIKESAAPGEYTVSATPLAKKNSTDVEAFLIAAKILVTEGLSATIPVSIAAPVNQATPQAAIADDIGYTGTLTWLGTPSRFSANTVYSANVVLTAKTGYQFVNGASISVSGATVTGNTIGADGSTLTATAVFPATADKEAPICRAPTGVTATYGQTLSAIKLVNPISNTAGMWTWMEPTTSVGTVSATPKIFKAKFTPTDTESYKEISNIDVPVTIIAKHITVTVGDITDQEYTGAQIRPTLSVAGDSKPLIPGIDYTVTYGTNTAVGANSGSVTVKAMSGGNYAFTDTTEKFNIIAKAGMVSISGNLSVTYGMPVPDVAVNKHGSDGELMVYYYTNPACTEGKTSTKPTNVGDYWVKAEMAAGVSYGSAASNVLSFTISRANITPVVSITGWTYQNTPQQPSVAGNTGGGTVTYQYKLKSAAETAYSTAVPENAGEYTVKAEIAQTANYNASSTTKDFTISPKSITASMLAAVINQAYTGNAIKPIPAVTDGTVLEEHIDFTYSYESNTYVGSSAKVTVIGKGNYTGTASKNFSITAVNQNLAVTGAVSTNGLSVVKGGTLTAQQLAAAITGAQGELTFTITSDPGATGSSITGNVFTAGAATGEVTVKATAAAKDVDGSGSNEYNANTTGVTFTVKVTKKADADVVFSSPVPISKTYGDADFTVSGAVYAPGTGTGVWTWDVDDPTILQIIGDGSNTAIVKILKSGTAKISVQYESDTTLDIGYATVTVGKKTLTAADLEYSTGAKTRTYDGTTASDVTVRVKAGSLVGSDTLAVPGIAAFNSKDVASASKITFTSTALTSDKYELTAGAVVEITGASITPRPVTVNAAAASRAFGAAEPAFVGTVDAGTPLATGDEYSGLGMSYATAATAASPVGTYDVTGSGTNANYAVTVSGSGKLTITKAAAQTLADISASRKYTVTDAQAAELGNCGMPANAGTLAYAKGTETTTGSVAVSSWSVDENGTVSFTLTGGAANDTVTLPVIIRSTNYADSTVNLVITLTDKDIPTASAADITVAYTGSAVPDAAITGTASVPGAWSFQAAPPTAVAESGTHTVVFTPTDSENYATVEQSITVTIQKAAPTGAPAYTPITATDKTLADAALDMGTIAPAGGVLAWDLGDSQPVAANTAYGWTYTPADTANYDTLTGSITPYVVIITPSYVPSYSVTALVAEHGSVTLSQSRTSANSRITVTAKPEAGYVLESLTAADGSGKAVALTQNANGTYSFTMPASSVVVKALFQAVAPVVVNPFTDVQEGAYYYDAVLWAVKENVTQGTSATTFSPEAPCTRAQVMTFLWRAAGCPEPESAASFSDVAADHYYAKAVAWAAEQGITGGTGPDTFSPDAVCTRSQIAAFLYRFAGSPAVSGEMPFADVDTGAYYADAVLWAVQEGVTQGTGASTFGPHTTCTRTQIVTFLYRLFGE